MKKKVTTIVIVLLMGACIFPVMAQEIDDSSHSFSQRDWWYVGGNGPGNYTSIQEAIDNASDGDTVFVYNGTYDENVVINKTINLIGEDKNTTIIDSEGTGSPVYIASEAVSISNFTLTHSGSTWPDSAIRLYYSNNTKIMDMIISNCNIGIQLFFSNNNTITANSVSNNNRSIYLIWSKDNCISGNDVLNSKDGIWVDFSNTNTLMGNDVHSNTNYGVILTTSSTNNVIEGNVVSNNSWGIYLSVSRDNIIAENNVIDNICGILLSYSYNNTYYHNNIINNTQNAFDEDNNIWDNGYPSCGNFWSNYTGTDDDGDGVGDTPYLIPGSGNMDRYPLMEPYGMTILSLKIGGGSFRFSLVIKNTGNATAFNVSWDTHIEGTLVFFGKHSFGTLFKPLRAGEETRVSSSFLFGFGKILIRMAVWADNAPYVFVATPGTLLLFFIKI